MSDAWIVLITAAINASAIIWGNKKVLDVKTDVGTVQAAVGTIKAAVVTVQEEVVMVKEKVAVVHDQVNSKMDKQLKMTKALAKAEQKVEDAINGKHKIIPDKKKVPVKKKK